MSPAPHEQCRELQNCDLRDRSLFCASSGRHRHTSRTARLGRLSQRTRICVATGANLPGQPPLSEAPLLSLLLFPSHSSRDLNHENGQSLRFLSAWLQAAVRSVMEVLMYQTSALQHFPLGSFSQFACLCFVSPQETLTS